MYKSLGLTSFPTELEKANFQVKLWAGLLVLLALVNLILGSVTGLWTSIVFGAIGMLVGGSGVYSATSYRVGFAKFYFWSLITLLVINAIVTLLLVGMIARADCRGHNRDDYVCDHSKGTMIAIVVCVGLVVPLLSLGGCAYCARTYVHELDESYRRDPIVSDPYSSGYQLPPEVPPPPSAPPLPYDYEGPAV